MPRTTWLNLLIILLVLIAASYVAQVLIQFLSGFSDIILILVLSWLVAYALSPLIDALNERSLPAFITRAAQELDPSHLGKFAATFRVSRMLAVTLVYIGLVVVVLIIVAALIPAILAQVNLIAPQLSRMDLLLASLAQSLERILGRLGFSSVIQNLLQNAVTGLNALAAPILQNTVSFLTGILSLIGNVLLILLLSFFLALDGPRFMRMLFAVLPERLHQEMRMFILTTDRAFGGYLRSQLVQALAMGIVTVLVLGIFGIQAALVSGLFAGLFMLIPLIGPVFSLVPPLLATVLTDPSRILLVMVPLVVFQFVLVNMLMPRIIGEALGLHPLVIIVSLLIGIKVGGFWGAFFAMPLAGIISAFGAFLIRRRQRLTELTDAIIQNDAAPAHKED